MEEDLILRKILVTTFNEMAAEEDIEEINHMIGKIFINS